MIIEHVNWGEVVSAQPPWLEFLVVAPPEMPPHSGISSFFGLKRGGDDSAS
jgi:hypothetical protein